MKKYAVWLLLGGLVLAYGGYVLSTGTCPLCALGDRLGGERSAAGEKAVSAAGANAEVAQEGNQYAGVDWELPDLDGEMVAAKDFAGKVVVLNFWATWCGPCVKEIPHFVEVQAAYRDRGVAFVGISLDQQGAGVVKPVAQKLQMNYPVVMGTREVVQKFGGINAIPVTLILDRQGNIVSKNVGMLSKEKLEKQIEEALGKVL